MTIKIIDFKAEAHKKFGFTGVPGLVIINKKSNVRLHHHGYNQSKSFQKNLNKTSYQLLYIFNLRNNTLLIS